MVGSELFSQGTEVNKKFYKLYKFVFLQKNIKKKKKRKKREKKIKGLDYESICAFSLEAPRSHEKKRTIFI